MSTARRVTLSNGLLFFSCLACSKESGPPPTTVAVADASPDVSVGVEAAAPPPLPPLTMRSAYCANKPCRTYDEAVVRIKKLGSPGGGPGCLEGTAGTCGAYRYVFYNDGFGSSEEWFDGSGAMIGVHVAADTNPDGTTMGTIPTCTKVPKEKLCGRR